MTHVLVLEDEPVIGYAVGEILEDAGFHPTVVHSGREALKLLEAGLVTDVMVVDVIMPDMTGTEFLERVRQDPRWAATPVVVTTGAERTVGEFPAPHIYQALLQKPFSIKALIGALIAVTA